MRYIPYEAMEMFEELMPLLITYAVFMIFIMVLGLVTYILRGIAIFTMSKKRGMQNGWMGFIPIVYRYQYGALAGTIEFGKKTVKNPGLWTLLSPILFNAVFLIGYIPMIFSFVFQAMRFDEHYMPQALTGFFAGIFIFVFIMMLLQVFVYLFRYLALHKIFSQYHEGQRPVFYMIISMFVPCAEAILLFMHRDKPMRIDPVRDALEEAPAGEIPNP